MRENPFRAEDNPRTIPFEFLPDLPILPGIMATTPNHRTMAEYYIRGITQGFVTAAEVIRWADEVIVASAKTEDWMLDISTAGEDDRMGVLHHLHEVKGEIDQEALAGLLAGK